MANKYFNLRTQNLLVEATDGTKLKLKDRITGETHEADNEKTITYVEESIDATLQSKWMVSLDGAGRDRINQRIKLDSGCPKCKTLVVNMRQYGEQRRVIYSCSECFYNWSLE